MSVKSLMRSPQSRLHSLSIPSAGRTLVYQIDGLLYCLPPLFLRRSLSSSSQPLPYFSFLPPPSLLMYLAPFIHHILKLQIHTRSCLCPLCASRWEEDFIITSKFGDLSLSIKNSKKSYSSPDSQAQNLGFKQKVCILSINLNI